MAKTKVGKAGVVLVDKHEQDIAAGDTIQDLQHIARFPGDKIYRTLDGVRHGKPLPARAKGGRKK